MKKNKILIVLMAIFVSYVIYDYISRKNKNLAAIERTIEAVKRNDFKTALSVYSIDMDNQGDLGIVSSLKSLIDKNTCDKFQKIQFSDVIKKSFTLFLIEKMKETSLSSFSVNLEGAECLVKHWDVQKFGIDVNEFYLLTIKTHQRKYFEQLVTPVVNSYEFKKNNNENIERMKFIKTLWSNPDIDNLIMRATNIESYIVKNDIGIETELNICSKTKDEREALLADAKSEFKKFKKNHYWISGLIIQQTFKNPPIYEVVLNSSGNHAILRMTETSYTSQGNFNLSVKYLGMQDIEVKGGFTQSWPVYEEYRAISIDTKNYQEKITQYEKLKEICAKPSILIPHLESLANNFNENVKKFLNSEKLDDSPTAPEPEMKTAMDTKGHKKQNCNGDDRNDCLAKSCKAGLQDSCLNLAFLKEDAGDIEGAKQISDGLCDAGVTAGCSHLGMIARKRGFIKEAKLQFYKACQGGLTDACEQLEEIENELSKK